LSTELRGSDIVAVRGQLGRDPTTSFSVVARCGAGGLHPLVIRNQPTDVNGEPFPTTFWLTCPDAVRAVARLESEGWIGRLNDRVQADERFDAELEAAHRAYATERARDLEEAGAWGGVGGTRTGIKCLHAHYAYHLAGGKDPVGSWVAERVEPIHELQRQGRVAAVDQGTNSIRLLVVEPGEPEPIELARDTIITRLGKGVDSTGRLDPEALERTTDVLATYCRRSRALAAERIRVAATSAVRDASNSADYQDAVRRLAGSELEVISGEREAGLSFLGGTRGLDPADGPFFVLDIGGGSTEIVVGSRPGIADRAVSLQIGSVRLTERHVRHDPPAPSDLEELQVDVDAALDGVAAQIRSEAARTLVVVAGTATTIQAISLGLGRYDPDAIHRTPLGREDVERTLLQLARMTNPERAALGVMAPGRGDVIVAGAVVLVRVMDLFGFAEALVSETDILDGLALEMLGLGQASVPDPIG
jgi:exopolyphosphatase/guanosine-5'-triphosphate,3'-diphosphate pyrophosphatase